MLKDIPDEQGIEMDQLGVSNIRYSTCLINDNELSLSNQELLPSLDSPPIRGDVSRPNKPELSAANLDETPMKREDTPPGAIPAYPSRYCPDSWEPERPPCSTRLQLFAASAWVLANIAAFVAAEAD